MLRIGAVSGKPASELVVPDVDVESLPLAGVRLERIERAAIRQTLRLTNGSKVLAAQALGIAVSTLYEKLKKYQL